jgi:hypothetical protein
VRLALGRESRVGVDLSDKEEAGMDELIRQLKEQVGLSEEQARRAAEVVAGLLKDEEKRKKIVTAAMAASVASAVVTGAI